MSDRPRLLQVALAAIREELSVSSPAGSANACDALARTRSGKYGPARAKRKPKKTEAVSYGIRHEVAIICARKLQNVLADSTA